MGAWGIGPFENDTALDWAGETDADLPAIEHAINEVLETKPNEYLDSDVGIIGIAACQSLVYYKNKKPGFISKWLGKNKPVPIEEALITNAIKAIDRIQSNNSELYELWQESDEFENWCQTNKDLKEKINNLN